MLKDVNPDQLDIIIELLQTYLLYAAIALIVIAVAMAIAIKIIAPDKLRAFAGIYTAIAVGFSLCVIFCLLSLTIARYVLLDRINLTFWLSTGLLIGLLLLTLVGIVLKLSGSKAFKLYAIISSCAVIIYCIVLLITVPAKEEYYAPTNTTLFYILTAALIAIMSGIVLIFGKKQIKCSATKAITYAAVSIAMSFALSYIKFFSMPQGGSVTFASMLPLMIYAYVFGVRKGLFCGIIYGLLQFLQSPQLYQPMQFFIDYPIAFGAIGLAGMFNGVKLFKGNRMIEFCLGGIIAVILRYVSHILSGAFVFYTWAGDANPWTYSIVYNSFVFVDLAIVLAVGIFLFMNKSFNELINRLDTTVSDNQ